MLPHNHGTMTDRSCPCESGRSLDAFPPPAEPEHADRKRQQPCQHVHSRTAPPRPGRPPDRNKRRRGARRVNPHCRVCRPSSLASPTASASLETSPRHLGTDGWRAPRFSMPPRIRRSSRRTQVRCRAQRPRTSETRQQPHRSLARPQSCPQQQTCHSRISGRSFHQGDLRSRTSPRHRSPHWSLAAHRSAPLEGACRDGT
mmetsp:Transcript_43506/g.114795  ORF Transcript_43506/g.114795 Transcript_43506/m.114795 type:complete len:201 (+) Transcript_43506:953-1555(+)